MGTRVAAVGTAVFLRMPAVVAGALRRYLSRWEVIGPIRRGWPLRLLGVALIVIGAATLVAAFVRFVVEGIGTPAPVAPTSHLVVGGLYRYVRNPMYLAVVASIVGQAFLLGQSDLVVYATIAWTAMAAFAEWYETPALRRQFGDEYLEYTRAVPAWIPRRPKGRP